MHIAAAEFIVTGVGQHYYFVFRSTFPCVCLYFDADQVPCQHDVQLGGGVVCSLLGITVSRRG